MILIGRLTKDATAKKLEDKREVVNFSLAINDFIKQKNGELIKTTTYVNCSYWFSKKIAERLTRGSLVEIFGRPHVDVYISSQGEPKASFNCQVNFIKIHQQGKQRPSEEYEDPNPDSLVKEEPGINQELSF
jgi:single-strand DNA-binding protein